MKHNTPRTLFFMICLIAGSILITSAFTPRIVTAEQKAVCVTAAADYSSGAFALVSVDPQGGPRKVQTNIHPTVSDLGVDSFGRYFYVTERYMGDNITKYDIANPTIPLWQYSVMDETDTVSTVNPYAMVFAGPTKAYVLRNNSSFAWIVNPEATEESAFKTGVLDLSAYNDQDSIGPEMISGVIVKDKLFIVVQRLNQDDNWTPNPAYMAVFDTNTNQEIYTGKGKEKNGILLPVKNPSAICYEPVSNMIYVQGQGTLETSWNGTPADYSGGIVSINPDTYATSLLIDDGDEANHPWGNISGMTVHSPDKGYFIGYNGWGNNTLYGFNPSTGEVTGIVNDLLVEKNLAGMESGAYGDKNGMLWVTSSTDASIFIVNTDDNSIDEVISTELNPLKIAFVSNDILQTRINNSNLIMNWYFTENIANYTLYYAMAPLTAESEIFTFDLSALGNPAQLTVPGLPSGFSVVTAIQGETPSGKIIFSNLADVTVP
ncbi:MAG: hypothetical protein U9P10_09285 [Thermodesulfobacteriota bacterium]|nr:hypothetical protein [Thermodesulfobacteriota bacterium]